MDVFGRDGVYLSGGVDVFGWLSTVRRMTTRELTHDVIYRCCRGR